MPASDSSAEKSQPYQVFILTLRIFGAGLLMLIYLSTLKIIYYQISEGVFL